MHTVRYGMLRWNFIQETNFWIQWGISTNLLNVMNSDFSGGVDMKSAHVRTRGTTTWDDTFTVLCKQYNAMVSVIVYIVNTSLL